MQTCLEKKPFNYTILWHIKALRQFQKDNIHSKKRKHIFLFLLNTSTNTFPRKNTDIKILSWKDLKVYISIIIYIFKCREKMWKFEKKEKRIHMLFFFWLHTHTNTNNKTRWHLVEFFFFRIYIYMCTHTYEDTVAFLFD